jgi:hypothetical protein
MQPENSNYKLWINVQKKQHNFNLPKALITTSAVSRKRSNCLWPEIEGIVTSLNVTQDLKKFGSFLAHFKDWIAKELLEWTRVSCKKACLYITIYYQATCKKSVSIHYFFLPKLYKQYLTYRLYTYKSMSVLDMGP